MFYIYAYLRQDGSPYYIGKGKGNRAFSNQHRINLPEKDKIVIMESNLTETGAIALERFYIRWYGRKDLGTGILRNLTDGGEGSSGWKLTEEQLKKWSEVKIGKKIGPKSDEAKKKLSKSLKGRDPWNKGKKNIYSEEYIRNQSEKKKGNKVCKDRIWITDGSSNKRIYPDQNIPYGFRLGITK